MIVLPNAPVDIATGLPVPTIAVATAGGVSVIKDDGTIQSKTEAGDQAFRVEFDQRGGLWAGYAHKVGNIGLQAFSYDSVDIATANRRTYGHAISGVPNLMLGYSGGASGLDVFALITYCKNHDAFGFGKYLGIKHGLCLFSQNRESASKGMVSYITETYNTGWLPGDIKGAWMADTVAETLTAAELVVDPGFDNSGSWSVNGGATISGGLLSINGGAFYSNSTYLEAGKQYIVTLTATSGGNAYVHLGDAYKLVSLAVGVNKIQITTTTFTGYGAYVHCDGGGSYILSDISVKLAEEDRSVKANGLGVYGSLAKAAVASGSQLIGYSGFSAANYLEQPYNSDLDFGTGDFCYMGWYDSSSTTAANTRVVLRRGKTTTNSYGMVEIYVSAADNALDFITRNSAEAQAFVSGNTVVTTQIPVFIVCLRRSGVLEIYINAVLDATVASTIDVSPIEADRAKSTLQFGTNGTYGVDATLALWRASTTAPTAEQIKHIYETEKLLFEANAQCCIAGTSNAVTALAYDDETDLLHVGTSYGRSTFKGLTRVASEAAVVGSITALSASGGIIAQGGASGVDIYVPAYNLREELCREAEQVAKFGAALVATRFTATASQTGFQLPVGYEIEIVYRNGLLLWPGSTEDYTTTFDGFRWSVVLADASVVGDQITVMGVRRNG
jgi:hypothetical protein